MTHRLADEIRALSAAAPSMMAAALLTGAIAAGLAVALTNSDALVARSFETALAAPYADTGAASPKANLVAGTEEFWLKRARADRSQNIEPAAWPGDAAALGLSVGDRITVTSRSGERVLEVVAVSEADADVTRIDTGATDSHRLLVTCRDTSAKDAPLVRFVTETAAKAQPARVL
jgi:hypothetical protein